MGAIVTFGPYHIGMDVPLTRRGCVTMVVMRRSRYGNLRIMHVRHFDEPPTLARDHIYWLIWWWYWQRVLHP